MVKTTKKRDASVVEPTQPMKNPSRERMKAEIAFLRGKLGSLESTKYQLMKQKRQRVGDTINTKSSAAAPVISAGSPREEYEKRMTAEQENIQLRVALSHQLQSVKNMIISLHAQASSNTAWLSLERLPSLSNVLNDENGYRFSVLSASVDRMYTQVDQMIQFTSDNTEQHLGYVSKLTGHTMDTCSQKLLMVEGRSTSVFAFDLEQCQTALWRAIKEASRSEYLMVVEHESTADSVILRLCSTHHVHGETSGVTASVVIKRFVEADRMVVVWRSVSSLDGVDGLELDSDVYVDGAGWSVMQRVVDDDRNELAVNKCCVQWTPRSFSIYGDHAIAIHPETKTFTNLVLAASVKDMDEICDVMENVLIEDCLSESD